MTVGISPKNPRDYVGPDLFLVSAVTRPRRPVSGSAGVDHRQPSNGKLYPVNSFWQVGKDPTTGTEGEIWVLSKIVANTPTWVMLSSGGGNQLVSLTSLDNSTTVFGDASGDIDLSSEVISAGTTTPIEIVGTESDPTHLHNFRLQIADTVTPTPVDNTNVGLCCFNENDFTIDSTSGMVSSTASEFTWVEETGDTRNLTGNQGVIGNRATAQTFTLPATCTVGDTFRILNKGIGLITIAQNAGQSIHFGSTSSTSGVTGSVTATAQWDVISFICVSTDTYFTAISSIGAWDVI